MDILYSRVFSSCSPAARERCHSILSAIVIFETPTIATLSDLLQIHTSHLLLDLHHLANIIKVEELPTLPTTVTHSEFPVAAYLSPIVSFSDDSWREFCKNKSRAGDFWVDSEATHKSLLERADLLLARSISPSPIHIHHSTWKMIFYYLTDAWSDNKAKDDFVGYWKASWPLFAEEFKTFQSSDPTQQGVLTGNQQCVRAFRLLLRCFTEDTDPRFLSKDLAFTTARSVVSASLLSWFKDQPRLQSDYGDLDKTFLHLLPYLDHSEASMWTETIKNINEESHISFDSLFRIITHSNGFVDLDTGNPDENGDPTSHVLRINIDWSLLDLIKDANAVGQNLFETHRQIQICALRNRYEDFLDAEDLELLHQIAWGMFSKPMRRPEILTLKFGMDDSTTSSMYALIDRIGAPPPQSLAVLLSPNMSYTASHALFIPLLRFVVVNFQAASALENTFTKLKDLLVIFIQHGVLDAAFRDTDYHDVLQQGNLLTIYESLSDSDGLNPKKWLDFVDDTTHTIIIKCFLTERLMGRVENKKVAGLCVDWSYHFERANNSPKIVELLLSLRLRLESGGSRIISNYAPLLSSGSFLVGLRNWQEKYVERHTEAAHGLDELCGQLASVDWAAAVGRRGF